MAGVMAALVMPPAIDAAWGGGRRQWTCATGSAQRQRQRVGGATCLDSACHVCWRVGKRGAREQGRLGRHMIVVRLRLRVGWRRCLCLCWSLCWLLRWLLRLRLRLLPM